jgi:parvulin-like peptidyl-prolyl isomerase
LRSSFRAILIGLLLAVAAAAFAQSPAESPAPPGEQGRVEASDTFATVNETVITWGEYGGALQAAARQKFYHGRPPEAEVARLQREVANDMVNRVLLLEEAKRRGMQPDREAVDKQIAQYEQRYGASEQWKKSREQILPGLTRHLEERDMLQRLESAVRNVPPPGEETLKDFYDKNPGLFTEPSKVRASVILLKVDPSSGSPAWKAATEEAERIIAKIRGGAAFAELARLHSGDSTAAAGGDMGWLHLGTLPAPVQAVLDRLKPGETAPDPVQVLEGVAILRLDGVQPEQKKSFGEVQERVRALWQREQAEQAWKSFLAQLRQNAKVQIDESKLLPLAETEAGKDSGKVH